MKHSRKNIFFTVIAVGTAIALFFLARAAYRNLPIFDFFSSSFMERMGGVEEEKKAVFLGNMPGNTQNGARPVFSGLIEPVNNFAKRVSKKPFGAFVSPENSPVSPERFRGYHTGADAEIFTGEEKKNVFVSAVADGTVVSARSAVGYGGLVIIEHAIDESVSGTIEGKKIYGIYGHIRLSSVIINSGDRVKAGDIIGVLGEAYSDDAGGERKHFHFGLFQGAVPDIRGYVEKKEELQHWFNPLHFF